MKSSPIDEEFTNNSFMKVSRDVERPMQLILPFEDESQE